MKISSVTLSVSALALTASAATIVPSPASLPIKLEHNPTSEEIHRVHYDHDQDKFLNTLQRDHLHGSTPLPRMIRRFKVAHGDSSTHHKRRLPSKGTYHQQQLSRAKRFQTRYEKSRAASKTQDAFPPLKQIQSGVPGFVEVAVPVLKSGLARTVSGLAYSMNPATSGVGFELGTSRSQSTQFFMSPLDGSPSTPLYQLRVPILDSGSFKPVDHCATFAISPPGPLSLQPCGSITGSSQAFSYDSESGELQPMYGQSAPALISGSGRNILPLQRYRHKRPAQENSSTSLDALTPSSHSNDTQQDDSSNSSTLSGPSSQTNSTVMSKRGLPATGLPLASSPASVVLYFIPAEGFYQTPATLDELMSPAVVPSPTMRNTVQSEGLGQNTNSSSSIAFTSLPSVTVPPEILSQVAAILGSTRPASQTNEPVSRSTLDNSTANTTDPTIANNTAMANPDAVSGVITSVSEANSTNDSQPVDNSTISNQNTSTTSDNSTLSQNQSATPSTRMS